MGWLTFYKGIYDAIEALLNTLVPTHLGQVAMSLNTGKGFTARKFPIALIIPGPARSQKADALGTGSVDEYGVVLEGDIIVLVRETEPENAFNDMVDPLSDVVDKLHSDATLGGLVFDVASEFDFNPGQVQYGGKLYWGGMTRFRITASYSA